MEEPFKLIIKAKFIRLKLTWKLYDQPLAYMMKIKNIIPDNKTILVEHDPKYPFSNTRLQHKQFSAN